MRFLERIRARFFWGVEENEKKISWINWNLVLASREKGGLDVGSLEAFNEALLQKWRWRLATNPEALWVKVIQAIYGKGGGILSVDQEITGSGVWRNIVKACKKLHENGTINFNNLKRKVGDGCNTSFWNETWCGSDTFKNKFPRLFALENRVECTVRERLNGSEELWDWRRPIRGGAEESQLSELKNRVHSYSFSESPDYWTWDLDEAGEFLVSSTRRHIDQVNLPTSSLTTRWNRYVPIKVNVFIWRLMHNRLPTRSNLVDRGIDLESILCPLCGDHVEVTKHFFLECSVSRKVWDVVGKWMDIVFPVGIDVIELLTWIDDSRMALIKKKAVESVILTTMWMIWHTRNTKIYDPQQYRLNVLYDKIVLLSFNWFVSRNNRVSIKWDSWLQNPILNIV